MKIKLADYAFMRQFGNYTYIVNTLSRKDIVFEDAEYFSKHIGREESDLKDVLSNLYEDFKDMDKATIRNDFIEFLTSLHQIGALCMDCETDIPDDVKEINGRGVDDVLPSPRELLDSYFEKTRTLFALQIDVTPACTERCIHCYIPEYEAKFLPFWKIKEVIDEFTDMGGLIFILSGGECMLHPDFCQILQYARSKDLMIKVLSNLTLCTEKVMYVLKETTSEVQTSLYSMDAKIHDSITKREGSWKETKNTIEGLRRIGLPCTISCPLMDVNQNDYPNVRKYALSIGAQPQTDIMIIAKMNGDVKNLDCRISPKKIEEVLRYQTNTSLEQNKDYFVNYFQTDSKLMQKERNEWLSRNLCSAGLSRICLDANGNYFPCPGFSGFVLGNCFHESLKWVWNESTNIAKLRSIKGMNLKKCASCQNRRYCSICLCRNYNETGDMLIPPEYNCEVARINRKVLEGIKNAT